MIRTSKSVTVKKGELVTAAFPSLGSTSIAGNNMFSGNMSVSTIGSGMLNNLDTLLFGLMPQDELSLYRYYRDIYAYDPIAGPAVDLMSTLPFSEFTLTGGTDADLEPYNNSIKQLQADSLLPDGAKDYLVVGKFCCTLLYDPSKKVFIDSIPHIVENLTITNSPLYNSSPMIELSLDRMTRQFLHSDNPYLSKLRSKIPGPMLQVLRSSNRVQLDPLTTVFVPRKDGTRSTGVSAYKRILPWYLIEKLLYRGTLSEVSRRQRSVGHITMGNENWDPTDQDLQAIAALFQQADLDPLGAVLATRPDVNYSEIRQGGDFFKIFDVQDQLNSLKYKALGISDGLLSGEANLNAADSALSVFLDQLRSFRATMTRMFFYEKIFPTIALIHNKRKKENLLDDVQDEVREGSSEEQHMEQRAQVLAKEKARYNFKPKDKSDLFIPTIHWQKQLRPEADREYMDVLNTLAEHGVPITLRSWAAAGGMDLDKMLHELEEDTLLRQAIQELVESTGSPEQEQDYQDQDQDEDVEEPGFKGLQDSDSDNVLNDFRTSGPEYKSVAKVLAAMHRSRRRPFLSRNFGSQSEVTASTKTGKKKWVHNQHQKARQQNEIVAKALTRLSDPQHFDQVLRNTKSRNKK